MAARAEPVTGSGDGEIGDAAPVYEVFRQEQEGEPMRHAGSVQAPDDELAAHYAREFYARRGESTRLWVVPRTAVRELDHPDLLKPVLDRSHKHPGGFILKDKLESARARSGRR